jgi:predicted phosphodiesterase
MPNKLPVTNQLVSRRTVLQNGSLLLATAATTRCFDLAAAAEQTQEAPAIRLGLLTDLHYADLDPAGDRHYRESLTKIREAITRFRELKIDQAIELGDFIDAAPTVEGEIANLKKIEREFSQLTCPRHYVLGNHCVYTLTKEEFLANSGAQKSFYSFDHQGIHFVVLDACFRTDGKSYGRKNYDWTDANLPNHELQWLKNDLKKSGSPTVVFVHQRLDTKQPYGIRNAVQAREILEQSGQVLAVFQGHNHINDHKMINKIHYVTLNAMVTGSGPAQNAYSILDIWKDGTMKLDGFRTHQDRALKPLG